MTRDPELERRYAALYAERAALWRLGEHGQLTAAQQQRIKDIAEVLRHVEAERRRVLRASEGGTDGWDTPPRAVDRR